MEHNAKTPAGTVTCKNCSHLFTGKYCNNCGQSADTHAINYHSILHEIQHSIFHVDKGILYTTQALLRNPGATIREYLDGKRVQHFKPFAYLFVLSTLYAILTRLSHKSNFLTSFLEGFYSGTNDEPDPSDLGFLGTALQWLIQHYAYTTLLLLPIVALSTYICFYKAKYNYFQHLVLNCYVAGLRTAIYLALLPFTYYITDKAINDRIDTLKAYGGVLITCWMFYSFFNTIRPGYRIVRSLLSYLVMICILLIMLLLFALISNLFG